MIIKPQTARKSNFFGRNIGQRCKFPTKKNIFPTLFDTPFEPPWVTLNYIESSMIQQLDTLDILHQYNLGNSRQHIYDEFSRIVIC